MLDTRKSNVNEINFEVFMSIFELVKEEQNVTFLFMEIYCRCYAFLLFFFFL